MLQKLRTLSLPQGIEDWVLFFALCFIVGFIPLIVYLQLVNYDSLVQNLHGRLNSANFFTYVRSLWLYLFSGTAMLLFFVRHKPVKSWVYVPIGFFIFFSVASTVFSQHPKMAFWGDVDRNEGLLTQLCYMGILFLTINLVKSKRELKLTIAVLLASATLVSIVGVLQFFGYDYLYGGFADKYLIPEHFKKLAPTFKVESMGQIPDQLVVTFGNGNYTGSYATMLFSLTLGLIIGFKHKINFLLIPLNFLLFFNLIGSKSRAGMLGSLIAFFILLIIYRSKLKEKAKLLAFLIASYVIIINGMDAYSLQHVKSRAFSNRPALPKTSLFGNFEDLRFEKDLASVVFDGLELKIRYKNQAVEFFDANDQLIPHRLIKKSDLKKEEQIVFATENTENHLPEIALTSAVVNSVNTEALEKAKGSKIALIEEEKFLVLFPENKMRGYVIFAWPEKNVLQIGRSGIMFYLAYTEKGFQILDQLGRAADIQEVEVWGFHGYEKFASGRGYIWSRTLPMLKKTILIGYGPDTFFIHYPNHDYLGKLRHVSKGIQRVIDKPHNMYLQIAINTGVVSLVAILSLFLNFFVTSWKLCKKQIVDNEIFVVLKSISLSLIAYLIAGIFNDSIISIAPVFWSLLGMGIKSQQLLAK